MPKARKDPKLRPVMPRVLSLALIAGRSDRNALGLDQPSKVVRHEHHRLLGLLSACSRAVRKCPPTSALNCASAIWRTGNLTV